MCPSFNRWQLVYYQLVTEIGIFSSTCNKQKVIPVTGGTGTHSKTFVVETSFPFHTHPTLPFTSGKNGVVRVSILHLVMSPVGLEIGLFLSFLFSTSPPPHPRKKAHYGSMRPCSRNHAYEYILFFSQVFGLSLGLFFFLCLISG